MLTASAARLRSSEAQVESIRAALELEDGRLYLVKFTSTAYELEAPLASDWGELPAGTLVTRAGSDAH